MDQSNAVTSNVPDENGRFGQFGGRYVPETLTQALDELSEQYEQARTDCRGSNA